MVPHLRNLCELQSDWNMSYLLDSNIFITAKNSMPMDIYTSFWKVISELAKSGKFRSIKKEEEELRKGKDELPVWIDNELPKDFFWVATANTLNALSSVIQWTTMNPIYTPAAKNEFAMVADSWIVAEALSQSMCVVTLESPDPLCKKRVKIPDVCNAVGVKYCSLNDAFRELGVTI